MSDGADLRVNERVVIPAEESHETASRSGGPGGQHVNRRNTRVTLRWNVQESRALEPAQRTRVMRRLGARLTRRHHLVVHASRHRSRARNRELARRRLAEVLDEALAKRRARVATSPSRSSQRRGLEAKRRRGALKRTRARPARDKDA